MFATFFLFQVVTSDLKKVKCICPDGVCTNITYRFNEINHICESHVSDLSQFDYFGGIFVAGEYTINGSLKTSIYVGDSATLSTFKITGSLRGLIIYDAPLTTLKFAVEPAGSAWDFRPALFSLNLYLVNQNDAKYYVDIDSASNYALGYVGAVSDSNGVKTVDLHDITITIDFTRADGLTGYYFESESKINEGISNLINDAYRSDPIISVKGEIQSAGYSNIPYFVQKLTDAKCVCTDNKCSHQRFSLSNELYQCEATGVSIDTVTDGTEGGIFTAGTYELSASSTLSIYVGDSATLSTFVISNSVAELIQYNDPITSLKFGTSPITEANNFVGFDATLTLLLSHENNPQYYVDINSANSYALCVVGSKSESGGVKTINLHGITLTIDFTGESTDTFKGYYFDATPATDEGVAMNDAYKSDPIISVKGEIQSAGYSTIPYFVQKLTDAKCVCTDNKCSHQRFSLSKLYQCEATGVSIDTVTDGTEGGIFTAGTYELSASSTLSIYVGDSATLSTFVISNSVAQLIQYNGPKTSFKFGTTPISADGLRSLTATLTLLLSHENNPTYSVSINSAGNYALGVFFTGNDIELLGITLSFDFVQLGQLNAYQFTSGITSTIGKRIKCYPNILAKGKLSNYEQFDTTNFITYTKEAYCICSSNNCVGKSVSSFSCRPVASINDIYKYGGIYVKGTYQISASLKAVIEIDAPNSSITVKDSKSGLIVPNNQLHTNDLTNPSGKMAFDTSSLAANQFAAKSNSDSGENLIIYLSSHKYNVKIESAGDYVLGIYSSQKSISLGNISLSMVYKQSGKLTGYRFVSNTLNSYQQDLPSCTSTLGNPVITVSGQITNANDFNSFIKLEETPTESTTSKGSLSGGAIAGIVIACVVVVGAAIAVVVIILLKKKKNSEGDETAKV